MRGRVLVVDDDPGIRESFELALQDHCDVVTASSLAEANAVLKGRAIDLVVLDYCLRDGPGSDVLQTIKRDWPSLPVIVITAYGSETLCAELFRLGARDYFPKPYNVDAVVAAVKELLALPKDGTRQNVLRDLRSPGIALHARPLHSGIQRALLWMQANYDERLSLRQVANAAGLSPFHFCRTFKATVHCGFRQYLTRLRIDKAKERLRQSQESVTEVAFAVGFSDLSCFYKAFHRATGQSPAAWRRSAHWEDRAILPK